MTSGQDWANEFIASSAATQAEQRRNWRLELERIERQLETHPENDFLLTSKQHLERLLRPVETNE